MTFGKRLRMLRESQGCRQEDIAEILGIGRTTYASYEQDFRQPDLTNLCKLADIFTVTTDYLLGRNEPK